MKARGWFVLGVLLLLPGCFDSLVGAQCAKGYSRCGHTCVLAGTCDQPDAAMDSEDDETGLGDVGSERSETLGPEAGDDAAWPDDVEDKDAELILPADATEVDATAVDAAAADSEPNDGAAPDSDDLSTDADGVDAIDAPAPYPDAPWGNPDLVSIDGEVDGADAPAEDAGARWLDSADASEEAGDLGLVDAEAGDAEALDTGGETGAPMCSDGQSVCGEQCSDLMTDPENCGACARICTSGVCSAGQCVNCSAEETVCGHSCVNLASNPDNCGVCGNPCASGLCSNSTCEMTGTGRVIVIGHDYSFSRPTKNRILGNAVFLWPSNPVQLLFYRGDASTAAVTGADGAIAQVATATGRMVNRITGEAGSLPTQLPSADVFLIYAQGGASNETLIQLGNSWRDALTTFVGRGGTVIVLDGDQAGNAGTVQIVATAGLLNLTRQASASGASAVCNVVARGDALATGLSRNYWCQDYSATFALHESAPTITSVVESVVGDASSAPVVISKIF